MCILCPIVHSITTISYNDSTHIQLMFENKNYTEINVTNNLNSSVPHRNWTNDDISLSSAQLLSWIKPDSDNQNKTIVKSDNHSNNEPNNVNLTDIHSRNSIIVVKRLLNFLNKNQNRREDDLGLPPDIADEYIDAVNPPKFRIPIQYGVQTYISSPIPPLSPYLNRIHAGSSVVSTKMNYSTPLKPNELIRNIELATLLKAELDAKKAELDLTKSYTPAPNLFALLPGGIKTDNPFLESNYKTPNRVKISTISTNRPYITSANNLNNNRFNYNTGQFVYSQGFPFQVSNPSVKPTLSTTTPHSISILSVNPTKLTILRTTTTIRPVTNKVKIKSVISSSSITTTTEIPVISSTVANTVKQNKSSDWSLRVNNQSIEWSSESNESKNLIIGIRGDKENQSHEPFITANTVTNNNHNKVIDNDYEPENNKSNKTDYNDYYSDNTSLNPNYTVPDGFSDHPGATYRLTTERLAYILIGSCCALSILCLIVVAMSVRCRDMCDEYRSWKKAEKAALRWQRHQYRLAHHQQDLSRYFRTPVETNQDSNGRITNGQISSAPAPMFGPTCCHCINCSSSWLFRDVNKGGWCCQRGYYHPAPRGKLPFGAASSVNTFMPRYANNNTNNYCDEGEDTDSLNASDLIENHHISHHNRQQQHHFGERPVSPSANSRPIQVSRHQQLRRIAQPNGNPGWIQSSELVDELHKKHCNISHISRDQIDHQNLNNFRSRNRQHLNENVVVWNNNDERLI